MASADRVDAEEEQLCAELTGKLLGLSRKCEAVMSPDTIASALLFAIVVYAQQRGVPDAVIAAFLREAGDDLEATTPAPPMMN